MNNLQFDVYNIVLKLGGDNNMENHVPIFTLTVPLKGGGVSLRPFPLHHPFRGETG